MLYHSFDTVKHFWERSPYQSLNAVLSYANDSSLSLERHAVDDSQ